MSVLDAICDVIFAPRNSLENPSVGLSEALDSETGWGMLGGNNRSSSGVNVTAEKALGFHAFYRACDLVGNYVGKLPVYICRKENGGLTKLTKHPNYQHLLFDPSLEMNAFIWKKTMEVHRMLEGNGYTFCRRNGRGQIVEFVLLDPCKTWPVRPNGGLLYYMTTKADGSYQLLKREDVIHIKSLSRDGLSGYGLRSIGRESLGAGIATIEYRARFFRNGAVPAVSIEVPGAMDPKAKAALAQSWNQLHAGVDNAHRTAVLTNGAKVNILSADAQKNQLTEQEKFSIIEVSNVAGVPPHKLGSSDRVAYNSLEQENQSFADDSLDWRLNDFELELRSKVFTEQEKLDENNVVVFDREQLIRADIPSMAAYLDKAVGGPWMTPDEARAKQGMQRRPGSEGDVLYGPGGAGAPTSPSAEPKPHDEPPKPTPSTPNNLPRAVLLRSCVKMAERIARNAQRVAKKPNGFMDWLDGIGDDHKRVMVEEFTPLVALVSPQGDAEALADSILELARLELLDLSGDVTTADALEGAVGEWSKRFTGDAMERTVSDLFPKETP